MSKPKKAEKTGINRKTLRKNASPVRLKKQSEQHRQPNDLPANALFDGATEKQITLLQHPHISAVQRQKIATRIGKSQGNQHLQNIVTTIQGNNHNASNGIIQRDVATGTLETSRGTEEIPGSVVTANMATFNDAQAQGLRTASNRARINSNTFGIEVLHAIQSFKDYADDKISDLEGETTGKDLLDSLVSITFSAIPIPGAGYLARTLGKNIGEAIVSELRSRLTGAVQNAADSSSEKSLKNAVTSLVSAARDSSTAMRDRATSDFDEMINPVIVKIEVGDELTSEEDDLVATFYRSSMDIIDENLTAEFGIPSTNNLVDLHVNLYTNLVQAFEREWFSATRTLRQSIYWSTIGSETGQSGTDAYAGYTSRRAGRERRRALESEGEAEN